MRAALATVFAFSSAEAEKAKLHPEEQREGRLSLFRGAAQGHRLAQALAPIAGPGLKRYA
jgi:hypothetical protein